MVKKRSKAVVIGGGIHGISSAIELAKEGLEVSLLEKNKDIMEGTSRATQNRAHLGYHYPRSPTTAIECREGLEFFRQKYPRTLIYQDEDYYLIERHNSLTSYEEYKNFCDEVQIPYKEETPSENFWNSENIDGGFKVAEPVYDLEMLTRILKKESSDLGVDIITDNVVIGFDVSKEEEYRIHSLENGVKGRVHDASIIVNATYAYSNNILKILGLEKDMTMYHLQKTEVVIARSKEKIPSLTVMDGPFVTLLPLTNCHDIGLFLVYDVKNSVLEQQEGYFLDDKISHTTNWSKMKEHGQKYFPFFENLEYLASNYGNRPVPMSVSDDSRNTRIKHHEKLPGVYSLLEGKFISAPLIANRLVRRIKEDGFISKNISKNFDSDGYVQNKISQNTKDRLK